MKNLLHRTSAFSLVEVTIAVGIAGFCLLAIFGLIPTALRSNQSAVEQTAATAILSSITSDLRATPPTVPPGTAATSQQYAINIPATDKGSAPQSLYFTSDRKIGTKQASRYLATITFLSTSGGRSASQALIKVSWPAAVPVANASGSVQMFAALDRN